MIVSLVVAWAENGVIGKDNRLPWRLPADLRYFQQLTTGHTIVMGRKTFDSIGKPLPNRHSIVITRRRDFHADGVDVARSLDEALAMAGGEDEVFIVGGAEIYRAALPLTDRMYVTVVHASPEGDVSFPPFDESDWTIVKSERHERDERHAEPYSFVVMERGEGGRLPVIDGR